MKSRSSIPQKTRISATGRTGIGQLLFRHLCRSPFTVALAGLLIACFCIQKLSGAFTDAMACSPAAVLHGRIWTILTYSFVHGGILHLVCNLFALTFFIPLEKLLGAKRCALYYVAGCLAGSLVHLAFSPSLEPLVGASAGICAGLALFCLYMPTHRIMFMFIIMPAWIAGVAFIALSVAGLLSGGVVAHDAHLAGVMIGFLGYATTPRSELSALPPIEQAQRTTKTPRPQLRRSILWVMQAFAYELLQSLNKSTHILQGIEVVWCIWGIFYIFLSLRLSFGSIIDRPVRGLMIWSLLLITIPYPALVHRDTEISMLLIAWAIGEILRYCLKETRTTPNPFNPTREEPLG
jgi:membrane associated rhomboid family serine protease